MKPDKGFVMADALLALMVASLLLTGLFGVTQNTLRMTRNAEKRLTATLIARSLLSNDQSHNATGTVSVSGIRYAWKITKRDRPPNPDDRVILTDTQIVITWPGRVDQGELSLSSASLRSLD
ncbi:hypothetical protein HY29_17915 [Hyphomonas beringensis]|uniref:Type II secretion system protein GspI C-terminal domain-containing protein n=1 Tax=Hyphomonas beringensis TaxID=1280946 RepID=A0A062U4X7_9PROT|nr:hypothetical protein [Hyphomonas beringensis]KCZ52818.1 hypothetical protein HY29_17915 [Hyphomonas beringensis]